MLPRSRCSVAGTTCETPRDTPCAETASCLLLYERGIPLGGAGTRIDFIGPVRRCKCKCWLINSLPQPFTSAAPVAIPALAQRFRPRRVAGVAMARPLRAALRHGRDQQHLLSAARGGDFRRVARACNSAPGVHTSRFSVLSSCSSSVRGFQVQVRGRPSFTSKRRTLNFELRTSNRT